MMRWRTALLYGGALAATVFLLEWLDWKHASRDYPTSAYIVAIALLFAALGLWVGRRSSIVDRAGGERNDRAIAALRMSPRELTVLELLAKGCQDKVIARRLGVSPNTVKTHLKNIYGKLEVDNRTAAAARARELAILP